MEGPALIGVGVQDQDILIVSPLVEAKNNDIVVAHVNEVQYIRRFVQHHHMTFLLPTDERQGYVPIRVEPSDLFYLSDVVLCSIHPLHPQARSVARDSSLRHSNLNQVLGLREPSVFCSQVKGYSMHDAGIFEGDILVIDREKLAAENDVIVAAWHGGFVVKRLVQVLNTIFLVSDHPLIPPLVVTQESGFHIWGTVMYCIHPLHPIVTHQLLQNRTRPR